MLRHDVAAVFRDPIRDSRVSDRWGWCCVSKYEVWAATRVAGVNASARVLLAHYIEHSWFDHDHKPAVSIAPRGVSYWGKNQLAKALGTTPKTIYSANVALAEAGYITISSRYREGDKKGSGGRTSNAVRVHLDIVLAHQIDAPALASEVLEVGAELEESSYPQPQVKITHNPQVKITSKGDAPGKKLPDPPGKNYPVPQVKITRHKVSNKKLVNKKLDAGNGDEHPTPAQPVENPNLTELTSAAAQAVTGLAAEPVAHRNAGDFARLCAIITQLYGPTVAAALTPDAIPESAVTIGKARAWLHAINKTAEATPAPASAGRCPIEPRHSEANTSTNTQHLPPQLLEPSSRHPGEPGTIPTPHKGTQSRTPDSGQTSNPEQPEPEYTHIPGQLDALDALAEIHPTPKAA